MSQTPFNKPSGSAPTGGGPPLDKKGSNPFKSSRQELYTGAHQAADTDDDRSAIHHTLGLSPNQAAPGNHGHKDLATLKAAYDAEHANDVDNLVVNGATANFTNGNRLWRRGQVVDLYINTTATAAVAGGVSIIQVPAAHLPLASQNMYFFSADSGTGTSRLLFMSATGAIVTTFAIGAGAGTLGCYKYLAVP